jgi:hypothetical protein
MRYLTGLGIAVLALMIGWPWLNSAAQVPGGSYRETCRDANVRGSALYANCKDTNNQWRATQLNDYQRCHGEIQNLNGNLTCTGQGGGYGYDRDHDGNRDGDHGYYGNGGAPRGSYLQTCQNVRTDGNTLKASCQKVNNSGWRNTSLKNFNQCRAIENEDGHLRCR